MEDIETLEQVEVVDTLSNRFAVRLISALDESDRVAFNNSPTFSENRSVDYTPVTPIHLPGSIQVYKNTNSRQFNIGAKFVSPTSAIAARNMARLQTLRSWTMPYFGLGSNENSADRNSRVQSRLDPSRSQEGPTSLSAEQQNEEVKRRIRASSIELLGAPPMILYLYAYSDTVDTKQQGSGVSIRAHGKVNISRVPVVITTLNITYPDDVDYISTGISPTSTQNVSSDPFPTLMTVDIGLVETHSPREYETFSLSDFKEGKLANF